MKSPLTIVLPLHNQERQIRSLVNDMLDLAVQLRVNMQLIVVDDGSSDETYETACELACRFPQVLPLRQPVRRGLAAIADLVHNRAQAEMIILHDGVSPVDLMELRQLMLEESEIKRVVPLDNTARRSELDASGSCRLTSVRKLHDRMERVHRRISGFSWLKLEDKPLVPRRRQVVEQPINPTGTLPLGVATTYLPNLSTGASGTPTL